jgi:hypothetical protein
MLPLVNANACRGTQPPTRFGAQVYGNTGHGSANLTNIRTSGATWVRVPIGWSTVEPVNRPPSQFNWSTADAQLAGANDGCVNLIVTIDDAPEWAASGPRAPIYPSALSEFQQFVTELAERYDGDGVKDSPTGAVVQYWEFYNEPDLGERPQGTGWGEAGDEYAAMLQKVYAPMRATTGNQAKIVFGGITYDNFTDIGFDFVRSFLEDALKAGACEYFDVMNFHYYPHFQRFWTDNNGTGLPEKTQAIRTLLQQYSCQKPIIVTEIGYHSSPTFLPNLPSSEALQSLYVTQLFVQAHALDLDFLIWWTLADQSNSELGAFGLIGRDPAATPKRALVAFRTAHNRLRSAQFAGALSIAETQNADLEVYRFAEPGSGPLYVAWLNYRAWMNPTQAVAAVPLVLTAEKAVVFDRYDNPLAAIQDADDGANDGKVTVQVGGDPVFIEVN